MIIIGVTGNIGCGKTTVAKFFAKRGVCIIDADRIAHRLLNTGTAAGRKVLRNFGPTILSREYRIDRKKLAALAFLNAKNWQFLCRTVHPETIRLLKEEIRQVCRSNREAVVIDAALLIESGVDRLVDYIIVVKAGLNQQLTRTKKKLGLSTQDFKKRLRFQLSLKEKLKRADFVIDNKKTLKFTERQVEEIWKKIIVSQNRSVK